MVRAAASTGREKASKKEVIRTDQINNGVFDHLIPKGFIFMIVTIKLIEPRIEETPAICKLRIPKSTAQLEWKTSLERGGYTVQPVPTPEPNTALLINKEREGGRSQNLILFKRG